MIFFSLFIILLLPFWLICLFLLKNSVFPTWESGNLSDWVIVLCNVVMAGAAFYAALQAKKWFSNKKMELGHASAKELFLTLFKMNPIIDNLSTHVAMFSASPESDNNLKDIENILLELYSLISDFEKSIFELNGVGWKFKDKYANIYNLPLRIDIELIPLSYRCEEVIYFYDLQHDPENLPYSSSAFENNVKELLNITAEYNSTISIILNESLQYEQYFQIESF